MTELGSLDPAMALERMLRFMGLSQRIDERLYEPSARLDKVFAEVNDLLPDLLAKLTPDQQVQVVPQLERLRGRDPYGLLADALMEVLRHLQTPAVEAWKVLLREQVNLQPKTPESLQFGTAVDYLQQLELKGDNIDAYVELEKTKPDSRQDSLQVAELLYQAKRYSEALEWVRREPTGMRILNIGEVTVAAGPGFRETGRRGLEADILDGLKRRDEARAIRWKEFERTLHPAVLRAHIAKLDDFAEFDELDRAFDLVRRSDRLHEALSFLIQWPRLDFAADYVMRHAKKWPNQHYQLLVEAADALSGEYPVPATLLYRVLLRDILDRGVSSAYPHGAAYLAALHELQGKLPDALPFSSHRDFISEIKNKHGRKYGFWPLIPAELL